MKGNGTGSGLPWNHSLPDLALPSVGLRTRPSGEIPPTPAKGITFPGSHSWLSLRLHSKVMQHVPDQRAQGLVMIHGPGRRD